MEKASVLASFLLIILIVAGSITVVNAETQTTTYDHGDARKTSLDGTLVFAFDVKVSMETEVGGGWICGNMYLMNWSFRLDYVNPALSNCSDFRVVCYLPAAIGDNPEVSTQGVTNQTELSSQQKTGTLSAALTPANTSNGFFSSITLPFDVYIDGVKSTDDWQEPTWYQNTGFSTNIAESEALLHVFLAPSPTPAAPTFPTLLVAIVLSIAASISIATIAVTRRKCRRKQASDSNPLLS